MTIIRSIGAEFATRLYYPVAIVGSILCGLLLAGIMFLTTLSQWWLLLLIPIIVVISVVFGLLFITWQIIRTVRPAQTKIQRSAVKAFVDKLERISDNIKTPKIILLIRVVRDVAAPRKDGFIGSMVDDTASLKRDYNELQKIFG